MRRSQRSTAKPGRKTPKPESKVLFAAELAVAIVLGAMVVTVRTSLGGELVLLLAMAALCARMVLTSPLTFSVDWSDKALMLGGAAALVGCLGYPSARERLHELRHPEDQAGARAANDVMPADLLVTDVDVQPPTKDAGLTFNVHVENDGQTPAIALTAFGGVIATGSPMDVSGEDKSFPLLTQIPLVAPSAMDRYGAADLAVGDPTGPEAITGEKLETYIAKKANLYMMIIMHYRNMSDRKLYYTEYCQYVSFDLPPDERWQTAPARLCQRHNTTYVAPVGRLERATRLLSKLVFG